MTEADRARANGPALEKMYQFLLWLVPTVDKMPRAQKFTLGDRIQHVLSRPDPSLLLAK